jgi:ParB family chromosome partitioning protein
VSQKEARVESIGLRRINPREIEKNPENPRLIFEPKDLEVLKKSIEESGILVPLLVYLREKDGKHVILDGQRRWMCLR